MSTTLGGLLQKLLDYLWSFWPFIVVEPWEQSVIIRMGHVRKLSTSTNGIRGTGLQWVWPILETSYSHECNLETVETECQTVDGWTFTLGIQYRVKRLDLWLTNVRDGETAVCDAVRAAAARVLQSTGIQDDFGTRVKRSAKGYMRAWGVEILKVTPITVVEAPCLRLITDSSGGGGTSVHLSS